MMKFTIISLMVLFTLKVYSEEKITYPELLVVPLASDRLSIEANQEKQSFMRGYGIYGASVLATTLAGVYSIAYPSEHPDNKLVSYLTTGIGASFLGLSYFISSKSLYEKSAYLIKKMPAQTTNDKLLRERLAEERLDDIANFNFRLRFSTALVQIAMGAILFNTAKSNAPTMYASIATIIAGGVNMFLPHPSENVSDIQKSYKKKIYGYLLPYFEKNKKTVGLIAKFEY